VLLCLSGNPPAAEQPLMTIPLNVIYIPQLRCKIFAATEALRHRKKMHFFSASVPQWQISYLLRSSNKELCGKQPRKRNKIFIFIV